MATLYTSGMAVFRSIRKKSILRIPLGSSSLHDGLQSEPNLGPKVKWKRDESRPSNRSAHGTEQRPPVGLPLGTHLQGVETLNLRALLLAVEEEKEGDMHSLQLRVC